MNVYIHVKRVVLSLKQNSTSVDSVQMSIDQLWLKIKANYSLVDVSTKVESRNLIYPGKFFPRVPKLES